MCVTSRGKDALTVYRVIENYRDAVALDINIITGRTHQIRVHLQHINHPIIGDPTYGYKNSTKLISEEIQSIKRQALHAKSLRFLHPGSKSEVEYTAPLPNDIHQLMQWLEENKKTLLGARATQI